MTADTASDQQAEVPAVPGVTRWRKRPLEVEAVQWTGENEVAIKEFTGYKHWCLVPHGWYAVREGGQCSVLAAEDFAATYEPAGPLLTPAQCDRLRQIVTEWGDASRAVRRALDVAGARVRSAEDARIFAAAREALAVLEGGEESHG